MALLLFWLGVNLVKTPSDFFQIFLIGITTGCVYALVALGYTLVYGILELINFAHGDVFMLGGMFTITYADDFFGLHRPGDRDRPDRIRDVHPMAMASCGAINAAIEFVAYRPLRGEPRLAPLITAIGMSFMIENVGLKFWRARTTSRAAVLPAQRRLLIGGVTYELGQADHVADHRARPARARSTSCSARGRARRCARPRRTWTPAR